MNNKCFLCGIQLDIFEDCRCYEDTDSSLPEYTIQEDMELLGD